MTETQQPAQAAPATVQARPAGYIGDQAVLLTHASILDEALPQWTAALERGPGIADEMAATVALATLAELGAAVDRIRVQLMAELYGPAATAGEMTMQYCSCAGQHREGCTNDVPGGLPPLAKPEDEKSDPADTEESTP
jgi:hypothetical protein